MKNNALLNEEIFGTDQLLKLTALVYLKDALAAQKYEIAPELIATAKQAGAVQEEISTVIADYLNGGSPGNGHKTNRLRK